MPCFETPFGAHIQTNKCGVKTTSADQENYTLKPHLEPLPIDKHTIIVKLIEVLCLRTEKLGLSVSDFKHCKAPHPTPDDKPH